MTTIPEVLPPDKAKALRRLGERIATDTTERNALIVEAHRAGASTREIGDAVGLTNVGVWRIIKKAGES